MTSNLHPGAAERALAAGPAACLILGARGIGRRELALQAAARHIGADTPRVDPDLRILTGVEGAPATAEDARAFVADMRMSGERGQRAGVILDVDDLNAYAAAALLKLVEEPRPGVRLLLTARSTASLPPALLSRCSRLRLPHPEPDAARRWLASARPDLGEQAIDDLLDLAGGAPKIAAELADSDALTLQDTICRITAPVARGGDTVDMARLKALSDAGARAGLDALARFLERAARASSGAQMRPVPTGEDKLIAALAKRAGPARLAELWRDVTRIAGKQEDAHLDAADALLRAGALVGALNRPGAGR